MRKSQDAQEKPKRHSSSPQTRVWIMTLCAVSIIFVGLLILNSIVIADTVSLADLELTATSLDTTNDWIVEMLTQTATASETFVITLTPNHP